MLPFLKKLFDVKLTWQWSSIIAATMIVLITFVAYYPAIYGEFIWDDFLHFVNNPVMTDKDGLKRIWTAGEAYYFPLSLTTFWIERRVWDLQPMGYHIVNIGFHSINAVLFWLLLRRMGIRGAWLAGAIFALHPVFVDSVAWITELKNLQSGFFYLLALLSYLAFEEKRKTIWYIVALLMFILALLSKTSTVMLPIILFLYLWWSGRSWKWRDVCMIMPFVFISAVASVWTVWDQRYHQGVVGEEWSAGLAERIAISGHVIWFYLGKLLVPYNLAFVYPQWSIDPQAISSYIPVFATIALFAIIWWQRQKWGRSILAGFSYFVISLVPVMGFVSMYYFRYTYVADHFQYLAAMGIIALVVGGVTWGIDKWCLMQTGERTEWYGVKVSLGVIVLLVFGILTWRHTHVYHDLETLWLDTIKKNPRSWMAHNNLGILYHNQGKDNEAINELREAVRLKSDYGDAYYNLGIAYVKQGWFDRAIKEYRKALDLNPDDAEIHNNLGFAYGKLDRYDKAIEEFRVAIQLKPNFVDAHRNLAGVYHKSWLLREAIAEYKTVLELEPLNADSYNNLGVVYGQMGFLDEAAAAFQEALRINPDNKEARQNLEKTLSMKGL